jgi:hypothetical protein
MDIQIRVTEKGIRTVSALVNSKNQSDTLKFIESLSQAIEQLDCAARKALIQGGDQ